MSKAKILRNDDIRRLLEVKEFNKKNQRRDSSPANSDCSDKSDLSTQSMPQYSSYRTLSGGLFGPFEDSPTRPGSKSGFFHRTSNKSRDMSNSRLKTPSAIARPRGEGLARPSSAMAGETPTRPDLQRENSASRLPVFHREASMPQIKRESSIPQIKREKSDLQKPRKSTIATPRGSKTPIIPPTTPKTVEQRKVSERNNSAKGTRSGVSGFSNTVMIGDKVRISSNQKKGIVQFVGETRFAKGTWIGVVLDDATGKNDGSVGGVRYFTCPSLRGVFVREEKLIKVSAIPAPNTPHNNSGIFSVSRNDSAMSTDSGVEEEQELNIGDHVSISSAAGVRTGILRFVGVTEFAKGTWCGVELKEPNGKNDGAVAGTRYFQCQAKHGIFSQVGKVKKVASTFIKPELPRPTLSSVGNKVNSLESREINEALNAMEVSIDSSIVSPDTSQESLANSSILTDGGASAKIVYSKQLSTEHQENTLRLMNQINSMEKEKIELETRLNDTNKKVEDLQFQLEEQILLQDDAKGDHICSVNNEDFLKLKEDLAQKDSTIKSLQESLETVKNRTSKDTGDKNKQLQESDSVIKEKDNEVKALKDLLKQAEAKIEELKFKEDGMEAETGDKQLQEIDSVIKEKDNEVRTLKDLLKQAEAKNEELKFKQDEMEAESGELEKSQIEMTRLKDSYEAEMGKLRGEMNLLNETRLKEKSHMSQIEGTIKELSKAASELEIAKHENTKLQGSNQVLKQEVETLSKEISNVKASKEFIEEEMSFVRQEKEDLLKQIGDSKKLLDNNESKIQELSRDNDELQGNMKLLESEKEKLTRKCDELTNEHLQKSSDEVNELYKKNKEVEEQLAVSEREKLSQKNQWEEEKATLLSQQNDVSSSVNALKGELSYSKLQNETLSKELSELKTNKEFMQEEMECLKMEKDEGVTEKETLNEQYQGALLKIKELEKLDTETKEQLEKVTELRQQKASNELNNLMEEIKLKDQKIATCEQELTSVKKQMEEIVTLNKNDKDNNSNLQSQLEAKITELASYKEELETTQQNIVTLKNEMDEKNTQLKLSKSKEQDLEKELELSKQEKSKILKEKETLNKQYTQATGEQNKEKKDFEEQLQRRNETLNNEKNGLEEKLMILSEQSTQKQSELSSQITELEKQVQEVINTSNSTKVSLEAENSLLKNTIVTTEDSFKKIQAERIQLEAEVNVLKENNSTLERNTAAIQNIADADNGKVSHSQYNELKSQLEKIKNTKEEREAEVDFLNSIIVDLQKKNKDMDDKIQLMMYGDDLTATNGDSINNTMSPLKPGMRMRSFCDICDVFDLHDTEDCPKQCSDEVGSQNRGTRGEERPYCEICETFGHTSEDCDDEEMF